MGLTFADLQAISKEETGLFPPMDPLPILTSIKPEELEILDLQRGFVKRLRQSQYYLVETVKSTDLPRYSDKYRPIATAQPTLKRKDLNPSFFPPDLFDAHFNPRKKRKTKASTTKKGINLDDLKDDDDQSGSEKGSKDGSEQADEDYDVDEEDDNDYAENYFDNGEADDVDDLGGGGGGDEAGGGAGMFSPGSPTHG
ncbi:hypothetical protein SISNIDRAFT_419887 [Sistotremastrum niveocremeum HHB9708]|nr:hypothetical protein SISNIDRAFT_419887 [Sistotremastrum niveocremeum HHB9708]